MSSQIQRDRAAYYDILVATQKGELDITDWLTWFAQSYVRAIDAAETLSSKVSAGVVLAGACCQTPFSERQQKELTKLLEGFEGHMTARNGEVYSFEILEEART